MRLAQRLFGLLVVGLVLFVVAVIAARLDPPTELSGRPSAADGDSLRFAGDQRVRLLGIDAPELDQTCKDAAGAQWACGREAQRRLAAIIREGEVLCLGEGRDTYGRLLARCSVGDTDIGRSLVVDGWALSYSDYPGEEALARTARRGVWQGDFQRPRAYRDGVPEGGEIWDWLRGWLG